jgi:hypothetical protein
MSSITNMIVSRLVGIWQGMFLPLTGCLAGELITTRGDPQETHRIAWRMAASAGAMRHASMNSVLVPVAACLRPVPGGGATCCATLVTGALAVGFAELLAGLAPVTRPRRVWAAGRGW